MDNYQTIRAVYDGTVATLWLSRPEVHNAINSKMIHEITYFFQQIEELDELRVVVIRGSGESFCSGADLQWMKNAFALSKEENLRESEALAGMFSRIFHSSKVVIAMAHGNIFGGGIGLLAVCDLVYGISSASFCLSETKIGMAAATITPYLLQKMSPATLKELIFTAGNFNGNQAMGYGILNRSFPSNEIVEAYLHEVLTRITANGRRAIVASKQLINQLSQEAMIKKMEQIPELLASIRVSSEAQEGFSAFLEKRKPVW
jgi:methylglutaconyl-CoA hydratase